MINEMKKLNKLYQAVKTENNNLEAVIYSKGEVYEDPETTEEERQEISKQINYLEELIWENTHKLRLEEDKVFQMFIASLEDEEDKKTIKQAMGNIVRRENILTRLMQKFVRSTAIYTCC